MHKKTELGLIFGTAGVLYAYGTLEARRAPQAVNSPAAIATIVGTLLAVFGAYRWSPKVGVGLGVGLFASGYYNQYRRSRGQDPLPLPGLTVSLGFKRHGLDSNMDDETASAVHTALAKERDPLMLHAFAAKLAAAGHQLAAKLVSKKACTLSPDGRPKEVWWAAGDVSVTGDASADVLEAQHILTDLGYIVEENGWLGPQTISALKKFQSLYDLDIDGQLTPETLAALRHARKAA